MIVGGGAAGLSAALVLGRARRRVLLVDAGEQSNRSAHGIGGLLGHDGRPPAELYALGRAEIAAYPTVEVRGGRVVAAGRAGGGDAAPRPSATGADGDLVGPGADGDPSGSATVPSFVLTLDDGTVHRTGRVLLATGMRYRVPDLPGFRELWGDTVFHCPFCHGWEARDGRLAVLGAFGAVHRALLLRSWSADVVLLTDGAELDPADRAALRTAGIPIDERPVAGLASADGALRAVRFADGTELERDGLLAYAPLEQRGTLAADLGAAHTDRGTIDVDGFTQTTVRGLHAAGDASTVAAPQVATAIAEGSFAAAMIVDALVAAEHGRAPMAPARAAWDAVPA